MFIGEYSYSIDSKGRLAVPKKFRSALLKGAVITRGLDSCLFLYTKKEWEEIARKLSSLPMSQKNTRAFSRLMLAGAMDVSLDKQGRITIPEYLRTYAGIVKSSVIAGLYSRLEIWDEKKWSTYKAETEKQSEEIAEQLSELGV
ncbi:division/cell wall cluster transcriptional repressor MraZ [Patescibacteria group bacterium]|nr:division/cell wall cluster transcriptional repressor MraZ [Patescibacteria group bacterium]